ncbi:MAG: FixH family protein [Solirubrobacterales bacterium]
MRAWWAAAVGIAALAVPAAALAGGWATVGLSSTPDGLGPGESWVVELEVLQHGQTPLQGVEPAVTINEPGTRAERTFPAKPTERPGVYRAEVVFPGAGEWEYAIDDGFTRTHPNPPVRIGRGGEAAAPAAPQRPASSTSDGAPWARFGVTLAAGLVAAGLTMTVQNRRRQAGKAAGIEA